MSGIDQVAAGFGSDPFLAKQRLRLLDQEANGDVIAGFALGHVENAYLAGAELLVQLLFHFLDETPK